MVSDQGTSASTRKREKKERKKEKKRRKKNKNKNKKKKQKCMCEHINKKKISSFKHPNRIFAYSNRKSDCFDANVVHLVICSVKKKNKKQKKKKKKKKDTFSQTTSLG